MTLISQTFSAVSIKSSNDALTIISTFDSTQVLRVNTATKVVTIRDKLIVDTILWTSIDPNSGGLPPIAQSMPRVVEVHTTLANATIADGIAAASLLTPSDLDPVVVRIYPGIYVENNSSPITVPNGVYLCGLCPETIVVVPAQDNIIFSLVGNNVISNIRIINTSYSNNTAFDVTGSNAWFDNVLFQDVAYGIVHTGINLKINNCRIINTSDGNATAAGIYIDNVNAQVNINNTEFNAFNPAVEQINTSILVNDGNVRVQNCTFTDSLRSIRMTGGVVTVDICSFTCENNASKNSAILVSNGELVASNIICTRTGGTFIRAVELLGGGPITINNITCENLQICVKINNITEKVIIDGFTASNTTQTVLTLDSSTNVVVNELCVSTAITAVDSIDNSVFNLTNSTITDCTNGIVHNTNLTTTSVIQNCQVNTTTNAIIVTNAKINASGLNITGSDFGVDFSGSSLLNIIDSTFSNCTTGIRSISNTLSGVSSFNNCIFTSGDVGAIVNDSNITISGCYFNTQNDISISALDGSKLHIIGTNIGGNATSAIQVENINTIVRLYNCSLVVDTLNGVNLLDQASVEVCNSAIKFANIGINSDTSATSVIVQNSTLDNNTDFGENVVITSLTGSTDMMTSRPLIQQGALLSQDVSNIYSFNVLGSGLCVGGFGPYGSSYRILTDTGAGVFVDETDSSQFGGGFTYAGTGVNNAIYIGALSKFSGFRTTIADTVSALYDYRVEYWDGAMWSTVSTLSTATDAPYTSVANNIFSTNGNNTNAETVRLGQLINTPWSTTAVNGITRYWIRINIINAITVSPTLSRLRLTWHSRYVREDTGFCEYFGNARPAKLLNMYADAQDSMPGNINPTSGSINIDGGDFAFQNDKIEYPPGINTNKMWRIHLPPDIDTSLPLEFNWSWYKSSLPINDNVNSVLFEIRYGIVSDANNVDASGAVLPNRAHVTGNLITQALPASDSQYNASFPLTANTIVTSNTAGAPVTLWISLKRNNFDNNLDNVVVTQTSIGYTAWRDGGYIKYPI